MKTTDARVVLGFPPIWNVSWTGLHGNWHLPRVSPHYAQPAQQLSSSCRSLFAFLIHETAAANADRQAHGCKRGHDGRSAVTHKRKWNAGHWHETDDHADIFDNVKQVNTEDSHGDEESQFVTR